MRHVTLVCGPPCAGKTTYVQRHAQPDDYILDHDDLARRAGSTARWRHSREHRAIAEQMMYDGFDYIADSDDVVAWVIRSLPNAEDRADLATHLRADEVVVLTEPLDVLYARADARGSYGVRRAIDRWFERAELEDLPPCRPPHPASDQDPHQWMV